MYKNKKILCVIPARSGSKGLPGKNIKKLLDKPLIVYTIEQAKESRYIDRIIVSTDSQKIAKIAKANGAQVPFIRPKRLSTDKSNMIDVLLHAMDWMEKREKYSFDILVLLPVTAPLRRREDIDNSIRLLFRQNNDNVFSVTQAHQNPYFNMVEMDKQGYVKLVKKANFANRQQAPAVFDINGSVYVWWTDILRKKKGLFLKRSQIYIMPKERSVDIDDSFDFEIVKRLMESPIKNMRGDRGGENRREENRNEV